MTILIKIGIILIITIILMYFIKVKKKDNYNEYRRKLKHQNRIKNKVRLKTQNLKADVIVSEKDKQEQLQNLYLCIDLLVNKRHAKKLKKIISEKIENENKYSNWNILDEFLSHEISNLGIKENINFRRHLDWKQDSIELHDFIVRTARSNFNIDLSSNNICDLNKNKFINEAFPYYETALDKMNIKLRDIDINSDSYQIVLVKKENERELAQLIEEMGFKLRTIN